MDELDRLKQILARILSSKPSRLGRHPASKRSPKKQAELDFWRGLYGEITEKPQIADISAVDSSEKAENFNLTDEQWIALKPERRLFEVSKALSFPRYKSDLMIGPNELTDKCVLDLGCGPMGALAWFNAKFRVGVDELISDYSRIGYPLQAHPILYVDGVAENLPFSNSQFDVVISVNALDHVENFEAAISEIHRIVKREGKIFASINYQHKATTTEPILLSDNRVESAFNPYFKFTKIKSETTEYGYSKNCYHCQALK